jgi:eukaryotic-like serine/threonine-protein kinase
MPLASGTKLGPYEIQAQLGAGGMGEVYRALDTRLDRTVAIKVLASHLSSSPELKQRMEREGRAISSLNHPRICQLYDIGSQNGIDYLVMEFLQGETLAEMLRRGPLQLSEVLKIGIDVAEALAVAHRQGIVHRDLKPGNIMITSDGAKLMDFGLAKPIGLPSSSSSSASAPSFTAAPTLSGPTPLSPLTTAGSIVGTIQYMSPEQIEGKDADARSDIFAFGAVLYEMVAGKRPFAGKSQISLASSILESDPQPLNSLQPQTPAALEHVIKTCLQKNPGERYLAAHDIKLELRWIASERPAVAASSATPPEAGKTRERFFWAAGILIVFAFSLFGGAFLNRSQPQQSTRTVIDPPEKTTLALNGDFAGPPVLSPDGKNLAFVATGSDSKTLIWLRAMNSLQAHPLAGTDGATFPFWSPDGRSLGFFAEGQLKTTDLNGGAPVVLCEAQFGRGGAWGREGVIIFSPSTLTPLMRVSASGGTPQPLTKLDPALHTSHRWPFFLPDGRHFLYLGVHHDPSKSGNNAIYYASVDGKENRILFRSLSNAIYSSGYLLFARGDQLMAQPFDPDRGKLSGEPETVGGGVVNDVSTWHIDASASSDGLVVLGSGGAPDMQLVWMDRAGKQIATVADMLANLQTARISPQGDRLTLQIDNGVNDIWVLDLARGVRTRFTFGPVANMYPVWSPDGKWIVYTSDRNGKSNLLRKHSDGSGAEELLLTDQQVMTASDWSRDGKYIIYSRGALGSQSAIWALPVEGERKPWLVVPENASVDNGSLSPDGRWLAYSSTESGVPQIYVVPFRGGQGKWQVSSQSGTQPKWSRDGKELFFFQITGLVVTAVPVKETNGALEFGNAQPLARNPAWVAGFDAYDVSPDGKKILLHMISQAVNQSLTVITNFPAELKK